MDIKKEYNKLTLEQITLCLEILKHLNTEDNQVRDHYTSEIERLLKDIKL